MVEKHDFGDGRSRYEEAGDDHYRPPIDTKTRRGHQEFFDAEIERLKTEIAKRLGFELVGHKLELYGHAIPAPSRSNAKAWIYKRHAARVEPEAADSWSLIAALALPSPASAIISRA